MEHLSGVKQSQVSKIFSKQADPSPEVLVKLFKALGLKAGRYPARRTDVQRQRTSCYLATPLTAVVALNARTPSWKGSWLNFAASHRRMNSTAHDSTSTGLETTLTQPVTLTSNPIRSI